MDTPPTPPDGPAPRPPRDAPRDRLGAEVRDSVVLLTLSVAITAGLAAAAQALLWLLG